MASRPVNVWALVIATVILQAQLPVSAQPVDSIPIQLTPHHVTVSVADLDRESQWYQRVLGFHEASRSPHGAVMVCRLLIPGYRLDLVWIKGSARPPKSPRGLQQGWMNVVFATPSLESAYKHLLAQGIEVKVDRDAQAALEHLTFEDPEGNEIGIAPQ
jgi:catechol 2,3-dioxygenase-like lactoylglutathione lyase family enzyme